MLWMLLWGWLPQIWREAGRTLSLFPTYRELGSNAHFGSRWLPISTRVWYEHRRDRTALGLGGIVGGYICGRVADHRRRLMLLANSSILNGLIASLGFIDLPSHWCVVALAFGVGTLTRVSSVITPTLLVEIACSSRTTTTGLFAVSNQFGQIEGASLGVRC